MDDRAGMLERTQQWEVKKQAHSTRNICMCGVLGGESSGRGGQGGNSQRPGQAGLGLRSVS